ncbi:MAG: methyltransferase domain-containing protein [Patescibacteria group bacterium]
MIRNFFKRWPALYYTAVIVFGPTLLVGLNPKRFLRRYGEEGKIVNLGSGPRVLSPEIINVDIEKYEGVSIISDLADLPFEDGSISRIICDNVLEHVKDTARAVGEMKRILETGGFAYVSTPFLYPFHSSPSDYYRWSEEGLRAIFSEFEMVELGVRSGPFSALNTWLVYFFASLFSFGSERLFWILLDMFLILFFPVKFLDFLVLWIRPTRHLAAVYYCVVKKR